MKSLQMLLLCVLFLLLYSFIYLCICVAVKFGSFPLLVPFFTSFFSLLFIITSPIFIAIFFLRLPHSLCFFIPFPYLLLFLFFFYSQLLLLCLTHTYIILLYPLWMIDGRVSSRLTSLFPRSCPLNKSKHLFYKESNDR